LNYNRILDFPMNSGYTDAVDVVVETDIKSMKIERVMSYVKSLVGVPYRWHRKGDPISDTDKFYASNDGKIYDREMIDRENKCIVCTGLINLMRKYAGLSIPGLDGSLGEEGIYYPGTTGVWFMYLKRKGVLHPLDINKVYPSGTLLLRDFKDVVYDQGHVAVICGNEGNTGEYKEITNFPSILNQDIIHAYSRYGYIESKLRNITDVGEVSVEKVHLSHLWTKTGYYTHVCYPEDWLCSD
jgi:hypothetical protein